MTLAVDHTQFAEQLLTMINEDVSLDPSETIERETDLMLTGLVDSLGVVMIVHWLEDALGIEIEPSDVVLEHFQTVELMLTYLAGRAA